MTPQVARTPKYKVGDWVSLPRTPVRPVAQVIAYRGPIGPNGTHYYQLRRTYEWGEVKEFEQPEWALEPADMPVVT